MALAPRLYPLSDDPLNPRRTVPMEGAAGIRRTPTQAGVQFPVPDEPFMMETPAPTPENLVAGLRSSTAFQETLAPRRAPATPDVAGIRTPINQAGQRLSVPAQRYSVREAVPGITEVVDTQAAPGQARVFTNLLPATASAGQAAEYVAGLDTGRAVAPGLTSTAPTSAEATRGLRAVAALQGSPGGPVPVAATTAQPAYVPSFERTPVLPRAEGGFFDPLGANRRAVLEQEYAANIAQGLSPAEADQQAQISALTQTGGLQDRLVARELQRNLGLRAARGAAATEAQANLLTAQAAQARGVGQAGLIQAQTEQAQINAAATLAKLQTEGSKIFDVKTTSGGIDLRTGAPVTLTTRTTDNGYVIPDERLTYFAQEMAAYQAANPTVTDRDAANAVAQAMAESGLLVKETPAAV